MDRGSKHVISLLVDNRPGVIARVAVLFTRRGFNIESFVGAPTGYDGLSRLTIVVKGDDRQIENITKQLNKLVDIIKVSDFSPHETVERELAIIKVEIPEEKRPEVIQIVEVFRGKIVDVGTRTLTLEITGDEEKINAMVTLLKSYKVKEIIRTGRVAMKRGSKSTYK